MAGLVEARRNADCKLLWIIVSVSWFFGMQLFWSTRAMGRSAKLQTPIVFNIPAQPLARALAAYGAATGLDVFYDADLADKQRSSEVSGSLDPSEALQRLLLGTGYVARTTAPGAFTILRAPRAAPSDPTVPTETSMYRAYFATIQARISDALCRNANIASEPVEVLFRFWLAPSGVVARAEVIADNGDLTEDQSMATVIHGLAIGVPPSGMPQPVNMLILPPSSSSSVCRSTKTEGSRVEDSAR